MTELKPVKTNLSVDKSDKELAFYEHCVAKHPELFEILKE